MKEERKQETITYEGLGFPIVLINCPMKKKFGEWFLDINFEKLQKDILEHLVHKPSPLSGAQIRFIRKYFELTTTAFGEEFSVTHSAVLKWENGHLPPAPTDLCIRLFVLAKLFKEDAAFGRLYKELHDYLGKKSQASPEVLQIQADDYLAAAG